MSGPRTALALGAVLAAPLAARAYRPFNSTDAAVAEKGQVEIELGPFGLVQEGSDRWLVAPSVILNWGFADRWELVLEGRHFVHLGAAVAEPRRPIRTVPVWIAPCLWTALSFAASTLTVTDRFVKSKLPESAWPLIV